MNDYFLFCLNHLKHVKLIDKDYYDKNLLTKTLEKKVRKNSKRTIEKRK